MVFPVDVLLGCSASLYRYARALSGDPADAEELVQETYRRALTARHYPSSAKLEELRPWLFTILRNAWHNEVRRRHHDIAADTPHEAAIPATFESPEVVFERKLLRSEIRAAVESLPEALREVIVLREIEDLSYADIARIIHSPAGTVMSRLARARSLLRTALAQFAPSREVHR